MLKKKKNILYLHVGDDLVEESTHGAAKLLVHR
jgi:hypothetical protein